MIAAIIIAWINCWYAIQNGWRRLWRRRVDYIRLELSGTLPEFSADPPWWQRRFLGASAAPSLMGLRRQLQRIAADPQVKGVLLVINDLTCGWASIQSLRHELHSFRLSGKRIVAFLHSADNRNYCVACAADEVLMPPTAFLNLLGVRVEAVFLRDALKAAGISAEVSAVSPYKTGPDTFTHADISPENREQLERLVDQRFTVLIEAIASDRKLSTAQVQVLIDHAPLQAQAACEAGLIDATCYEDELAWRLAAKAAPDTKAAHNATADARPDVRILEWPTATRVLRIPYRKRQRKYVAVVSVEGTIAGGPSRNIPLPLPLIGGSMAGSDSIIQALRQVEQNKRIAALVLHIDSPGGDSFASDLIWRELLRLRQHIPVVVSMGNVAASGGYYIAAPAHAIVAQPATLTGSIGVYSLRPLVVELFERLGINTVVLSRGAHTGLLSSTSPPSDAERAAMQRIVFSIYADFKARVQSGRNLSEEQLEPIAGGRVWTGREAQQLGLVDELGGLPVAIAKARELAKLPADPSAPVLRVLGGRAHHQLQPEPFPLTNPSALPGLMQELLRPRILLALPWVLREW